MISTNTEKTFDALKKEGYEIVYWGGSQLIDQVNELNNGQDIIKKYNLLEFVDNCFIYMKNVLMHEKNLPFKFSSEESTSDMKGMVFKQKTLDKQKNEYIDEFIGYFSADKIIDEKTYITIYEKFGLSTLTIVTPDEKQTDYSLRMSEFYESIQLYKDYWYQEALAFTTNYTSINPGIIRLLQVAFNSSPYKPQYPLIELLRNLLDKIDYDRKSLLNIITLVEVCKVIEKHRIYELQDLVFEHLKAIPKKSKEIIIPVDEYAVYKKTGSGSAAASAVLREGESYIATLTEYLVKTLIALEKRDYELKQKMFELFDSENDIKFIIRILPYFSKFNMINDVKSKLVQIKEDHGDVTGRKSGAIDYINLNEVVNLRVNLAPFTVENEIDKVLINHPKQEVNK